MKHYKSILAFGDSFFAGCELLENWEHNHEFVSIHQADQYTKKLAFPQLLANKLDIPCYNYAMSGGSNARSMRNLFQAIQEHQSTISDSLILFGYTSTDRYEFYDHDLAPDQYCYFNQDQDNFIQIQSALVSKNTAHPMSQNFLKYCGHGYQNTDQLMFYVEAACKQHSVDCVHVPLFPYETLCHTPEHLFMFDGCLNYLDWATQHQFARHKYGHFDQQSHQVLSDMLFQYLNHDSLTVQL
jgi:hypothetical protein